MSKYKESLKESGWGISLVRFFYVKQKKDRHLNAGLLLNLLEAFIYKAFFVVLMMTAPI